MKSFLIFIISCLFCLPVANANNSQQTGPDYIATLPHTVFLPANGEVKNYDMGFSVRFDSPIPAIYEGHNLDSTLYYTDGNKTYAASVAGVLVTFTNNTDDILIIKSSQSNISLGSLSAIPFLSGMRYADAGNPSATPDIIIPPHKSIQKEIYADYYQFTDGDWLVNGVPVLKDNSLSSTLYLKMNTASGDSQYVTIESPNIGIPHNGIRDISKVVSDKNFVYKSPYFNFNR